MSNALVAEHLNKIATLFQIKGDKWRSSACLRAAEQVAGFGEVITKDNVTDIPCVGAGLAETILQFETTGTSDKFKKLAKEVDPQCLTMLVVKGLGPKTAWKFYQDGVKNFDQLVKFWEKGKMDARWDEPMRQALAKKEARLSFYVANHMGEVVLEKVSKVSGAIRASLCGSVRRKKETIKDLDILVSAKKKDQKGIIQAFTKLGKVINQGDTKASIWFSLNENTIQADLLVVDDESFGSALQYFTGSKEHNIEVRKLAQKNGFKVSEYGIFKGQKKVGGKDEEDIYKILGIEMPNPENR